MKIPSVEQIRALDAQTIEKEPISSIGLMERAATAAFRWIENMIPREKIMKIFCGTGNNGGDGLVIARLLAQKKRPVHVYILRMVGEGSADFQTNLERLRKNPKVFINELHDIEALPDIAPTDVVVDAIFGSGLNKAVTGPIATIITHLNHSAAFRKISIDLPSGLFTGDNAHNDGTVFKADVTLTFEFPKLAFFFAENYPYTGDWHVLPIGLHTASLEAAKVDHMYTLLPDVLPLIKKRQRFDHKGTYGHALLIAGSKGKIGAAVLAARGTLKAGAGLLSVHLPACGANVLTTAVPEAMTSIDQQEGHVVTLPDLGKANAIAVGPGLGTHPDTQKALKVLIQESALPIIYDADALNMLSENKTWLSFLTAESILTPHPGEFDRLAGKSASSYERLQKQKALSIKHGIYIILKGAYTSVSCPDGSVFFNATGNPGMATAGSGDVLTGVLLGLKAQGYSSLHTCLLGVYLHGLAGDVAANKRSQQALMAGDICEYLGKAWNLMQR